VSPIDSVDLDLLAEHLAGLLDPAEDARVARLVDTDPSWAGAYADLVAAQPLLDEALGGLGGAVPMPVDVADRLDAALAAETRTATVINLESRRRRRRFATAATAVAAAVVLVFGGYAALSALSGGAGTSSLNSSGGGAASDARPRAAAPLTAAGSLPPVLHSGTDYNPVNLGSAAARKAAPGPAAQAGGGSKTNELDSGGAGPADPATIAACLSDLVARYGGQPTLVDYALFKGRPAVIVVLTTGSTSRVVAAASTCGQPGAGPAEVYGITR
jgi:hypothetical protein